ncbi:DEAD/DEAH box helicase [Lampropedia cohaerens]|uniref:DEAD/DEAH box helicase n=1 Tax=Lampropedia cohaerens TaxID=1610491 RepID=UPI0006994D09
MTDQNSSASTLLAEDAMQAEAITATAIASNPFAQMGLAPSLVQAVLDLGYTTPTEVQSRAIPLTLHAAGPQDQGAAASQAFCDLMVSSQTGSGKTAAFLLPVLHTLIAAHEADKAAARAAFEQEAAQAAEQGLPAPKKPKRKNPLNRRFEAAAPGALILCPTRELALQVSRDAIDLMRHCRGVRIGTVIGGLPYPKQIAQLQNAALVVATPGRLLDLQRSGQIILDKVQFLVVDEADRMLDLGFSEDLEAIHQMTQQRQHTMMFSATFAPRIQQLGMRIMHDGGKHAQRIEVASAQQRHANITQKLFWADDPKHKRELLDTWLRDPSIDQAIVFASTQIECDSLAQDLQQEGFDAVALHGALNQGLRNRRLAALRAGRVQVLVATDVAARGIDVPTITHVFNYGLPMKSEDYTHRIGRTGRAGRNGLAISFAEFRDRRRIHDIEQFTNQPFEVATLPGLEPRQRFTPWRSAPGGRPSGNRNGGPGRSRYSNDGAPRHPGPSRTASSGPERGARGDYRGPRDAQTTGVAPSRRPAGDWNQSANSRGGRDDRPYRDGNGAGAPRRSGGRDEAPRRSSSAGARRTTAKPQHWN